MTDAQLKALFTYHPPQGNQGARYDQLRAGGHELARLINTLTPASAEQTAAIRRVQEAVMYANAAIACNEPDANAVAAPQAPRCALCGGEITPHELAETIRDGGVAHARCIDAHSR